ncbi:MAG: hypothetical protein Ct9H300mP20_10560 [Gammaproteobacteria bacterium]|nr:MAG: hypothetical protein Ct9H300mP20_10560 [Gammaproteobacteria bacterium]
MANGDNQATHAFAVLQPSLEEHPIGLHLMQILKMKRLVNSLRSIEKIQNLLRKE